MTDLHVRYLGCLLGLATGDALGATLEFKFPGTFAPIVDMIGGGPFGLTPGEWTDDTSMALCLAESLIERPTFDPVDQPLHPAIDEIARGSFKRKQPPAIKGTGYVVIEADAERLWQLARA